MTGDKMQCCYTNAVKEAGGKTSSGWQAVLISDNLPPEAYTACVNFQSANSTIQSHMVDEQGNVLNLFELNSDGAYVYVIRTQYGLTDRLGRPNMFSHAYIFSWKQEGVIRDPNVFLSLAKDHFAKDEESARSLKDRSEPQNLFTLESALAQAGMTAETYQTLLQCVYAQYSGNNPSKPIYVQYDGSDEQMRAILYCIYYGVPYCVRRNLSAASMATGTAKNYNLIFSVEADRYDCFVVPQTGKTNILIPRIQRKIERYGFVGYAARHYQEMDVNDYFQELERSAAELGDPTASDELILKIAHQRREAPALSQLPDPELNSCLSDALRVKSCASPDMERYISSMLSEICRRNMSLTKENEANLAQRLALAVTPELTEAEEQYNSYRLSLLSTEDAVKFLHDLAKPAFDRYRQTLLSRGENLEILDHFYAAYGLQDRERTWETLNALLDETESLPGAVRTRERIDAAAWELYYEQLEKPGEAYGAYCALMDLMGRLHEADRLDGCSASAKEAYWDRQTLQSFSHDRIDEYKNMRADTQQYELFMGFYQVLNAYQSSEESDFLRKLSKFASEHEDAFGSPRRPRLVLEKLKAELLAVSPQSEVLFAWINIVTLPAAEKAIDDILTLRTQLYHAEFDGLVNTFEKITLENNSFTGPNTLINALSELVEEECRRVDASGKQVPVDVWLTLGRCFYPGNAFQIFDKGNNCVSCTEDIHAADHSRLLGDWPFNCQAEQYAQRKGRAAKMVRKWIHANKHKPPANERKPRPAADGPALGESIMSFLSRPFSLQRPGREAKTGRPASGRDACPEENALGSRQAPEASDQSAGEQARITPEAAPEASLPEGTAAKDKQTEGKITPGEKEIII